jgi:HrpA-like RNA helicase
LTVQDAVVHLYGLEVFDTSFRLTDVGRQLSRLPLEPSRARAIVASRTFSCTSEVLDIVSALSANHNIYLDGGDIRDQIMEARAIFRHPSGDHITLLNVVKAYRDMKEREKKEGLSQWCRKHFLNEQALIEAGKIREQLIPVCQKLGIDPTTSCGVDMDSALKSLLAGLPWHLAQMHPDSGYRQLVGGGVSDPRASSTIRFLTTNRN